MKIAKKTKFIEFLNIVDVFKLGEKEFNEILKKVEKDRGKTIAGKPIPENLDKITLGQLVDIQNIKTTEDFIFKPAEILGITRDEMLQCTVHEVFSIVSFVRSEIERIVKLWDEIKYKPSPEEVQAGIGKINHGFFGTADWYARRMGYQDQQIVFDTVSWMKIYMCIKMDNENMKFEKKYREVLNKKKK
jgi:hypothetical protein